MRRTGLFLIASVVLWLAALAFVAKHSVDRLAVPPWGNVEGDARPPSFDTHTSMGQAFRAPLPGLYRIEIMLTGDLGNRTGQVTLLQWSDSGPDTVVHVRSFGTADLEDGQQYALEFEPQRRSKGQEYYFYLESSSTSSDDPIGVLYGPETDIDGATAYLNGNPIPGNLWFQTHYSLRTRDKLDLLLSRMAEGRPYLLGTKAFYVGLGVAYVILLGLFLLQIASLVTASDKGTE